ncbi:MAG: phosphoribosylanthranilate isomerase [Cyclobacteriaceae bacterium]
MSVKLKICGMRDPENILEVAALRPDFMGFIFYGGSPRCVPDDWVLPEIDESIRRVGVFVNENLDVVLKRVKRHRLDFVQLHGDEPVLECEKLKAAGVGVIKVFSVDHSFDFKVTSRYKGNVDYFLFDTKGKHYGGNAKTFDWNILKQYDQEIPFLLGGGIALNNIDDAVRLSGMNLHALDLNSGAEVSAGIKDVDQVKRIVENLKSKI